MEEVGPVGGICGMHGGHEPAEVRDFRRTSGGHRVRRGQGKEWMGCFLDDLRVINADQ